MSVPSHLLVQIPIASVEPLLGEAAEHFIVEYGLFQAGLYDQQPHHPLRQESDLLPNRGGD